jgi:glycosyltransferase involved in cell wall biosynthesis
MHPTLQLEASLPAQLQTGAEQHVDSKTINLLVDSLADEGLTNAQMINAREIVTRLDTDRFRVTMFTHNAPAPEIVRRPNTRMIRIPSHLQTVRVLAQFQFGKQDILFYLKPSPASRYFLKARRFLRSNCAIVASIESQMDWRDETIEPQAIRLIEQTVLRADYLFSNSAFVQRSLKENYGLPSEVVPTGVDTEFFFPDWSRPANLRPRVLFVGSLRAFKGPQVVLDAAQLFPQADFAIAGDGVMAGKIRERAQALHNVTMRGQLGRASVREEYRQADIFLFPSCWEGSPRVLLEAAASGLPVIARKDYEPESVIDGVTGFLAASDAEIMTHLAELLANPELRRSLGQSARSHVARFSWDVIARQWESVFARMAMTRRKVRQS